MIQKRFFSIVILAAMLLFAQSTFLSNAFAADKVYKLDVDAFIDAGMNAKDKAGKPVTGIVKMYGDNNKVVREMPYKDGKLEGVSISYFENGKVETEVPYKNGKVDGLVKSYFENGKIDTKFPVKNDLMDGAGNTYREDGSVKTEFVFNAGKLVSGACIDKKGAKRALTKEEITSINEDDGDVDCE